MNKPSGFVLPKSVPRGAAMVRIAGVIDALPLDKAWRVEIHEHKPSRSDAQNRYLWGVVYPYILNAGQLEGWEAEDVHEYCLGECYGWDVLEGFGRKRMHPLRRSSALSVTEFMDYIAFIQRTMAGHGIVVPDPDTNYFSRS